MEGASDIARELSLHYWRQHVERDQTNDEDYLERLYFHQQSVVGKTGKGGEWI